MPGTRPRTSRNPFSISERRKLEDRLAWLIRICGIPEQPERDYRFHPERKWRFDFAFPDRKLAFEVEGMCSWSGRHQRPGGYQADCEKYNAALLLGWRVYRFTGAHLKSTYAITTVEAAFKEEKPL